MYTTGDTFQNRAKKVHESTDGSENVSKSSDPGYASVIGGCTFAMGGWRVGRQVAEAAMLGDRQ